jgi:hypothetical protein
LIWSDNAQKISKSNSKAYRDHIKINPQSIKPTLNNIYKKKPQNHHKITTKSLNITQNHSKSLKITSKSREIARNHLETAPKKPKNAKNRLKTAQKPTADLFPGTRNRYFPPFSTVAALPPPIKTASSPEMAEIFANVWSSRPPRAPRIITGPRFSRFWSRFSSSLGENESKMSKN